MAYNKGLNALEKLTNNELIQLMANNGHGEFEEILKTHEVDGKRILTLQEFEVIRWKMPQSQKRKLWSCITELKENTQTFYAQGKPESKENVMVNKKESFLLQNNKIKEKLELVIGVKPPDNKTFKKPDVKLTPSTPPNEYVVMDKPPQNFDDGESYYDDNGYLMPSRNNTQEVEENDYEPTPSTRTVTNSIVHKPEDIKRPIAQRAPQTLPRERVTSGDYIPGPEVKKMPNASFSQDHSEQPPKIFPKVHVNQRNVSPRSMTPSPKPSTSQMSYESEEQENPEENYEPAPDVKHTPEFHEGLSLDTSENGTLSKKLMGFLKNHLGKKTEDTNSKKWNTLTKTSRDKSPTDSVKSLDRGPSFKSRPLPPLPQKSGFSNAEDQKPEMYWNIPPQGASLNEERPASPEQIYTNEITAQLDLALKLDKRFANTSHQNIPVPPRHPENYERYHLKKNTKSDTKRLPAPPNTLPIIPLNPHILSNSCDEDEGEEYNNAIFNINDEPFYRNTDRKGARLLLHDLKDGAFLFRPSKRFFLTLSLKYNGRYFNLGIEKTQSNKIRLNTDGDNMSPEFATITDFIKHFSREYLTFQHEGRIVEVFLKKVLPDDRF